MPDHHFRRDCGGTGDRPCDAGAYCLFADCPGAIDCAGCSSCTGDDIAEAYLDLGGEAGGA